MHPAFSVIFFTTASGAGYGLLGVLAVLAAWQVIPADRISGIVGLGLAFVLVSGGLMSSTFHLGHPERAWRALTQWRSSWLSREGVLAVLTYIPWLALAFAWIIREDISGVWGISAGLSVALAATTVYATAMIYASLKTVHQWCNPWTVRVYLMMALASGAVFACAVLASTGIAPQGLFAFTAVVLLVAWRVKRSYWHFIDTTHHASTPASATGLTGASVKLLEGPHTEENYLQQEMGFKVARKHAAKLRKIVHIATFAVPLVLLIVAYFSGGFAAASASILAAMSISLGLITERWLFFAEARHVVTLYYGAQAA